MFSILATLSLWKLNPRKWLTWYFEHMRGGRGQGSGGYPTVLAVEP